VGVLAALPGDFAVSAAVGFGALLLAPRFLPAPAALAAARRVHRFELPARMVVGALLAVLSSWLAARFGPRLGGYLALFPLVTSVIVIFTHALDGREAAVAFLGGMARGLWSAAVFCAVLALSLGRLGMAAAFVMATVTTTVMHAVLRPRGAPGPPRAAT
jgi:hypothetical protein